jgi:dipeptidyl aminopeptidase/acylaminoacyl peptidase
MPTKPRKPKYSFEQLVNVRAYQGSAAGPPVLQLHPDGKSLIYATNTSGQFNLWWQAASGGYPRQLTAFTDRTVRQAAFSPDGEQIVFTADNDGNEFHQIFLMPASGGQHEQITDAAPPGQHFLAGEPWSPDGKRIAYAANDRVPMDFDVCILDVKTRRVTRHEAEGKFLVAGSWSPDGRYLSVLDSRTPNDTSLFLLDTKKGTLEELTPHDDEVTYAPGPFTRDGSAFYVISNEGGEYPSLGLLELETRKISWIETPERSIEVVSISKDGKTMVWVENDEGYSRVRGRNLKTKKELELPDLPDGVLIAADISEDGKQAAAIVTTPAHPAEVLAMDLRKQVVNQLTYGFIGEVSDDDLVRPKRIKYQTFDDRKIPAFLYKPKGGGKFPVVLSIHGGPQAQELPVYNPLYQYLLSMGIGVMATNIRGSTGYGKTYEQLINRDWGGGDLKDWDHAVKYLHSLPWVDKDRVAVFGGSYGGFAALTCATRLPDYWAAAVDIVGPSNLVTFAKAVPPSWKRFIPKWVGDPETEVDFLMSRSPITYVDQVKAPMFIIQGALDPRVVKAESDQFVERLRARGVEVRYEVYEDEGHGFTKQVNRVKFVRQVADFLEEKLLNGGPAAK